MVAYCKQSPKFRGHEVACSLGGGFLLKLDESTYMQSEDALTDSGVVGKSVFVDF